MEDKHIQSDQRRHCPGTAAVFPALSGFQHFAGSLMAWSIWWSGRFSDSAGIAAVNNSSQIMQLVTSLVCGIATGGTVLIGQYIGARQEKEAGGLWATWCCSSPCWPRASPHCC